MKCAMLLSLSLTSILGTITLGCRSVPVPAKSSVDTISTSTPASSTTVIGLSEEPVTRKADIITPTAEALKKAKRVTSAVFSADGQFIAVIHAGIGKIEIQETASGKRLSSINVGAPVNTADDIYNNINSVAFSPDGSVLATTTGMVCVNCSPKTRLNNLPEIPPAIGKAQLWAARNGHLLHPLQKSQKKLEDSYNAVFSPNGKTIAVVTTLDNSSYVGLWDVKNGLFRQALEGSNLVTDLAYAPAGRSLVGGRRGSVWWLWDAQTGKKIRMLEGKPGSSEIIDFSADGKTLRGIYYAGEYWSYTKGVAAFWDVATGKIKQKLSEVDRPIAFSPNNALAAVYGENIKLFNVNKSGEVRERNLANIPPTDLEDEYSDQDNTPYASLHFSPDNNLLAVGTTYSTRGKIRRRQTRFFNAATGKPYKTSVTPSSTDKLLAFSPHSKAGEAVVATANDITNTVKLWHVRYRNN